ncbi:hypothetical protein DS2_10357 [Catenovulum agarivorans DS-2]|uniref:Uncharacterized protein n=1 Tax=Catenovulum agarivorans DS-2 TaxID=1328313 RepID=W7QX38_9ALTE|nr:hypothetical protein [Catenovulum agarivorans]EWH09845.1 hypothetical protein DS2_10357 [Catenovulum agarivorans DS-2]
MTNLLKNLLPQQGEILTIKELLKHFEDNNIVVYKKKGHEVVFDDSFRKDLESLLESQCITNLQGQASMQEIGLRIGVKGSLVIEDNTQVQIN